jgi:uridine kinase
VNTDKHLLIGIAGGSGSGKTTFLKAILDHFTPEELCLVSQDNYYRSKEEQYIDDNGVHNFDLPDSIDREHFWRDMERLKKNESLEILEYNFNNPNWKPQKVIVKPAPVIVMEGLFVFHYEEIRTSLDYKVYLDVHHETRLERRIRRDAEERGYPEDQVRYQWHNHVRPSEEQFLEPYKAQCELIVDNTHSFDTGLEQMKSVIQEFLKNVKL